MAARHRGAWEIVHQRVKAALSGMGNKQVRTDSLLPDSVRFRGGLPRAVVHPTTGRYINPWLTSAGNDPCEKSFREAMKMIREARQMPTAGPTLSKGDGEDPVNWDEIRAAVMNGTTSMTWLGHACVLITVRGSIFLVDPVFADRCSPLSFAGPKRFAPSPVTIDSLGSWPDDLAPRLILLSHGHYDHLCLTTLSALHKRFGTLDIIAPLGHRSTLESGKIEFGIVWSNHSVDDTSKDSGHNRLTELDWWGARSISGTKGLSVVAIPAQHWTSRYAWDRNKALWCGFSILADDGANSLLDQDVLHAPCEAIRNKDESAMHPLGSVKAVHAGDTGYCDALSVTRLHMGGPRPEIAAIPIGAYMPRWFMKEQHTNPSEGVQMHKELEALNSIAIHWGTFPLTTETTQTQLHDLGKARQELGISTDEFLAVLPGTTIHAEASPSVKAQLDITSQYKTIGPV